MNATPGRTVWNLGSRKLTFDRRPLVMGILNVTPDSFSDGGRHHDFDRAVAAAIQLVADGADILDIGGESTRPGSDPVSAEQELQRVVPVIAALKNRISIPIPISIDTSKAVVAAQAIAAGAEIINDVTGLAGDPQMMPLAVRCNAGVCIMHMRGTPQTMQDDPWYDDVLAEVTAYLLQRRAVCVQHGIRLDRICLDPGIGFGKTHEHNLTLLRATRHFVEQGSPILIGHSRKGFIAKLIGDKQTDRTAGTLGVTLAVAAAGAHVVRVHDVRATVEGLKLFVATGGMSLDVPTNASGQS